ncbi:MAG: hypothetical protein GXY65_02900 [Rhodococcus sp.]|uniref:hypothetical protein n=1 Tax=Rhodococcus sp. TaxID=1831 RepID=UPI0016931284|nr:hypothetical protein [Rhodococcus sp. (in: high G+C Gram-positive bacteria)]NLV78291.1 hypothetical protein [Rhodococcus sp. (in: high G+C Gram-positive bacteria)]
MPDSIEVDIPQLQAVSARFDRLAEEMSIIDTSDIDSDAATHFPGGASVVSGLALAEEATARALLRLADRAWSIHDTLDRVCKDYTNTVDYLVDELNKATPL